MVDAFFENRFFAMLLASAVAEIEKVPGRGRGTF
jgi:hypothetical protein